jgi:hypothetical protein
MPMINIKYDDAKITDDKIILLSHALKNIVSDSTSIKEVFVYADSPKIKINVAPIEVFIEMSAHKIENRETLFQDIKNNVIDWKKVNNFEYPITITLTPVDWKFEVGI